MNPSARAVAAEKLRGVQVRYEASEPLTPDFISEYCEASQQVWLCERDAEPREQARLAHLQRLIAFLKDFDSWTDRGEPSAIMGRQRLRAYIDRAESSSS